MKNYKKASMGILLGALLVPAAAQATVFYYDATNPVVIPDGYVSSTLAGDTHHYLDGGSFTALSGSTSYVYGNSITEGQVTQTFHQGSYIETFSSFSVTHGSQTVVDNSGRLVLGAGGDITYSSGSQYFSRSTSYVTNDAEVVNNGSFVFEAGSVVDGTGSYTQSAGGSIVVNGDLTQDSVNIIGSGYLGGSGTINGNVYASGSDVIINSGNSPGTLTINGDLTVEEGAKIVLEVGASGHDTLQVSGLFNLAEGTDIVFDFLDGLDETVLETLELSDFFEATTEDVNQPAPELEFSLFSTMNFSFQADTNEMVALNLGSNGKISQVPEPSTLALLIIGLAGLAVQRKRST